MTEMTTATGGGMLSREEMDAARERLPIVYVDVVPVRVDDEGTAIAVGLLLRAGEDGQIKRALVSGRVLYHERVRAALLRHIEKDLGPLALPRIPPAPQPFTVAEYFPTPGVTPFHDPRQHAVSLAYVVPVEDAGVEGLAQDEPESDDDCSEMPDDVAEVIAGEGTD